MMGWGLAAGALGCGGVPPECTVGSTCERVADGAGANQGDTLDDPDAPAYVPEKAPAVRAIERGALLQPTYSSTEVPEGDDDPRQLDHCARRTRDGLPVVSDCARLATSRPGEGKYAPQASRRPEEKLTGLAREEYLERHHAPVRGEDTYDGEHELSGWAAHLGLDESVEDSTFDAVGDMFDDKYDFWAYHPTLPADSLVEVTNERNNKRVRVNIYRSQPKGGYHGRITVLNYAAAARIDMVRRGRDRVTLEVLRYGPRVSRRAATRR